jgi:hypothetical protein
MSPEFTNHLVFGSEMNKTFRSIFKYKKIKSTNLGSKVKLQWGLNTHTSYLNAVKSYYRTYRASCPVNPFINQHLRTTLCIPNHILVQARLVSLSPDTIFRQNTLSFLRQHIKWL